MEVPAEILTVYDLARRWHRHPKTVYEAVAAGRIPHVRIGPRGIRFRLADIERVEAEALVPAR
jgi:excisionase family DNA binding protein